jgi:hypothetical protein
MSVEPIIAFGQQPCGFFPRRFLVAKIRTCAAAAAQMGGRIVFFAMTATTTRARHAPFAPSRDR